MIRISSRLPAVSVAAFLMLLPATPPATAQAGTVTTIAQARIPMVPLHHYHIYFTFNLDGCDPTQGYYILFQVNNDRTSTHCPETFCFAPWLNCAGGGVTKSRAGVASGTITTRQSGGWWSYQFAFEVNGAFTQIFDAARRAKAASGISRLLCNVYYERSAPISPSDPNYSILGPIAHAGDYPGVQVRNFRFVIQALGSGQSHLFAGRAANWGLSNAFLQNGAFGVGDFRLTPR